MMVFAVELDGRILTWGALTREWYGRAGQTEQLSKAVPFMFSMAADLSVSRASELLLWLSTWLPVERLLLEPRIPLHDVDCPMTNEDAGARTSCVCASLQWAAEDGSNRTEPEGGTAAHRHVWRRAEGTEWASECVGCEATQ